MPGGVGEKSKEIELFRRQLDGRSAYEDIAGATVDEQTVEFETRRRWEVARPAQHRTYPGGQLTRRERFHDVVICAEFEPEHAVRLFSSGGEQNHGYLVPLAYLSEGFKSIDNGQHHVENDQVGPRLKHQLHRSLAVGGFRNGKTLALEVGDHDFTHHRLVIDDEHS